MLTVLLYGLYNKLYRSAKKFLIAPLYKIQENRGGGQPLIIVNDFLIGGNS